MAKPTADFGLGSILSPRKGEGRGVEPQNLVTDPVPTAEQALESLDKSGSAVDESAASTAQENGSASRQGGLPFALAPSNATVKRRVQVELPEHIADGLKMMSMFQRRRQYEIVEELITSAVEEWKRRMAG